MVVVLYAARPGRSQASVPHRPLVTHLVIHSTPQAPSPSCLLLPLIPPPTPLTPPPSRPTLPPPTTLAGQGVGRSAEEIQLLVDEEGVYTEPAPEVQPGPEALYSQPKPEVAVMPQPQEHTTPLSRLAKAR